MDLSTHLSFNGQCEEAFQFYADCLGGEIITLMTWGDSPMAAQAPAGWEKKVVHATMVFGDRKGLQHEARLTGSDAPPPHYQKPQGFSVLLEVRAAEEAERIFRKLSDKGTVQMALQETFWAVRFGMLVDRFGTPWMINCGRPVV